MKIHNRNYHREYEEVEKFETGIVLTGGEAKMVREGAVKLENAFVKLYPDGAYLMNAEIQQYPYTRGQEYDPRRNRKLLLNKKELARLKAKIHSTPGLTIVPIVCYNKGRVFKLEIALSRGRKDIEKRKREKTRDIEIAEKREMKEHLKS